ncbi:hypothetical protein AXX17_ATUG02480 (mitochondrion) [Arabidopsis thaliana]|uniref:Uncharacterized protein n=1 Tax=Arabidopsis thaliana TaxID=3702 RepID=A0A178U9E7_ARATH|nr:hypothetical protein AXX17_ATUG02480 [Arabidopsis thaliana]
MMRKDYPELFKDEGEDHGDGSNSGTNSIVVVENCNTPIFQLDHEAQIQPANDLNPSENLMFPCDYKKREQVPRLSTETLDPNSTYRNTPQAIGDSVRVHLVPSCESSSPERFVPLRRSNRQANRKGDSSRKATEKGEEENVE